MTKVIMKNKIYGFKVIESIGEYKGYKLDYGIAFSKGSYMTYHYIRIENIQTNDIKYFGTWQPKKSHCKRVYGVVKNEYWFQAVREALKEYIN